MVALDSPFYPYEKILPGANDFYGTQFIPTKILNYLLDLPDKYGYAPIDDNSRPRVRLIKYLWYDGAKPLSEPLPTPTQKLSLLFDPTDPALDSDAATHPQGYRLYAQSFFGQSQTEAKTTIKLYIGREYPLGMRKTEIGLDFEIFCSVNLETNTRSDAYARAYAIEQCIKEALVGVNIAGVGAVNYDRSLHPDAGSREISDDGTNVGRLLRLSLTWNDGGNEWTDDAV